MSLFDYFQSRFGSIDFLFDSHCHLTSFSESELEKLVEDSLKAEVMKIIDIAVDIKTSRQTIANSKKFPNVIYPTAGIDPEIAIPGSELFVPDLTEDEISKLLSELEQLIEENKENLIMIGECGLDYYWIYKNKLSEKEITKSIKFQELLFKGQVRLAEKYNLPLSIHHRSSLEDCLQIVSEYREVKALFHSFTGNFAEVKLILEKGYGVGINGIVTYKTALELKQDIQKVFGNSFPLKPEDFYKKNIFFETDAPYLVPRKGKGVRNTPMNIGLIFDFLINK